MADIEKIIEKSFLYYDKVNLKYKEYIDTKNYTINDDTLTINFTDLNKKFNYNILGLFDNNNKTWFWSWALPDVKYNQKYQAKRLLDYAISLPLYGENSVAFVINSFFVNSRMEIQNKIQLEFILTLILYFLNKKKRWFYI